MSKPLKFEARLEPTGPNGSWCFTYFPFDYVATFGAKGRVPVTGTINGFPFRNSFMPMDGQFRMCVNREMQAGAQAKPGDTALFILQRDDKPRTVDLPPALKRALAADPAAKAVFDQLSYTLKKEHAAAIAGAKQPETVERRLQKIIASLHEKGKAGKQNPK